MTVKKMFKELISNGYLEKGTKLPDEEIRSLYNEMVADEANTSSTEAESEVAPMYVEVTKEEEESTMTKKYTEAYTNANTNEDKAQVLYLLVDTADGINNVHSDEYVKKDTLIDICKNLDIEVNRKTTRTDAVVLIKHYADALSAKPKQKKKPAPKSTEAQKASNSNTEAANKTNALLRLIKIHAIENQKKGYGYTVSAYMLCAYILQAGHGIMKLKGHENEITPKQRESVKAVRKWLLDKGYIKECTYKADNNVIVYTEDYDGADSHKSRMIPMYKAAGLKGIAVTSYKVTF